MDRIPATHATLANMPMMVADSVRAQTALPGNINQVRMGQCAQRALLPNTSLRQDRTTAISVPKAGTKETSKDYTARKLKQGSIPMQHKLQRSRAQMGQSPTRRAHPRARPATEESTFLGLKGRFAYHAKQGITKTCLARPSAMSAQPECTATALAAGHALSVPLDTTTMSRQLIRVRYPQQGTSPTILVLDTLLAVMANTQIQQG